MNRCNILRTGMLQSDSNRSRWRCSVSSALFSLFRTFSDKRQLRHQGCRSDRNAWAVSSIGRGLGGSCRRHGQKTGRFERGLLRTNLGLRDFPVPGILYDVKVVIRISEENEQGLEPEYD